MAKRFKMKLYVVDDGKERCVGVLSKGEFVDSFCCANAEPHEHELAALTEEDE